MADDIQIEQFRIADMDALFSFLRTAYPSEPRKSDPDFWNWHFLENPHTTPDDIPLWVVKSGGQIVGQLATIPVTLKIGENEKPAIWLVDFIVHAEYRGRGFGKQLVLAADEYCSTQMALGPNEQSGAIFRSLKWAVAGEIHRYHKMLYPGNAIAEIAKFDAARNIINHLYPPFRRGVGGRSRYDTLSVRPVASFDASFEDLWKRARSQWPCAIVRDPAYLKWQFTKQPVKKFEILGAYQHDRLVGYVVLFFRKPRYGSAPEKAAIADIVYDNSNAFDVIEVLLRSAIEVALQKRAGSLVTDVLDEQIEKRLQDLGFWRIKAAPELMVSSLEHKSLSYDARNWFLTRADSDLSIFESPNL